MVLSEVSVKKISSWLLRLIIVFERNKGGNVFHDFHESTTERLTLISSVLFAKTLFQRKAFEKVL